MWLSRRVKIAVFLLFFSIIILVLVGMVLPISSFGPAACEAECTNNLFHIRAALLSYHDENGRYPPAYIADGHGNPMHSWRVLLLKYLDKTLYDAYDFGEPWDGPKNKNLLAKMPSVYSCPNNRLNNQKRLNKLSEFTDYLAAVGPNSPLSGNKSKSMSEVFLGTILIIEVADSDIHWTEPRDLDVSKIDLGNESRDSFRSRISSKDPSGPGVILGDLKSIRVR